jgi:carnosine synthase
VEDLVNSYRQGVADLQSLVVVSGALEQRTDSSLGVSADKVLEMTVLLEQYLDGDEVDVDLVFSNGQWRYACVSDNGPTLEPYFNETWGLCPSLLPLMKQRELKDLAVKSVEALGFWSGVFHVELKYTSHGPHLIEVNARMGGGPIWEMNHRVWGVDLVEETLFCALGIPAKPQVSKKPLTHLGYYLVPSRVSGIVKSLPRFDLLREQEDVIWAKPFVKVGDRIVGPDEGFPSWVCDIAVMKPSSEEARDYVIKWEAENRVQV